MNAYSQGDAGAVAKRLYDSEMAKRQAGGAGVHERQPEVAIVYVYPVGIPAYDDAARRFVSTYRDFAPLDDHVLHVVFNGEGASDEHRAVFAGVPCVFHTHDNTGWDIGAFQWAARQIDCDMMVCFGALTHFKRAGWLRRMREAFQECGEGLYGASASYWFRPHIRTAGFWCHPELIRAYPKSVQTYPERYEFEHGAKSITSLAGHLGLGCWMVTWDGIFSEDEWRTPPDIFWRGDQSNALYYDRVFEAYEEHPLSKPFYAAAADGWGGDPRGRWLGKTQAQWAEETGTSSAEGQLHDPWGFLARQVLRGMKEAARDQREMNRVEDEFVAELGLDHLSWVRTPLIDRLGIPEGLLEWPDVAVAAMHSALRLNGFSGVPYQERPMSAAWTVPEGARLAGLRRFLLFVLQPFVDRQRYRDIHEGVLLALVSDELAWFRNRIGYLEKS